MIQKGRDSKKEIKKSSSTKELLPALVDMLVSEKRVQFRDKLGVEIEADLQESYGAFAEIDANELKRVLSNLINNAVEALPESTGRISITVRRTAKKVQIIVRDNGKGIPQEILSRLGQEGVSFGKEDTESGSGLGIYHAKKTIEGFGGTFEIGNVAGSGAMVTLTFPLSPTPHWFVDKLLLPEGGMVIVVDDDSSIHGVWKGRLSSSGIKDTQVEMINFSSAKDFSAWLETSPAKGRAALFLMDYELLGQNTTGLDLIENHKFSDRAILVTSRYEEAHIRIRTEKLGIKLIPKGMAGFVPIALQKSKIKFDWILIDDDSLVHQVWEMAAKDRNKTFKGFSDFESFQNESDDFDFESSIFIDANLSNNVRGEEVTKKVAELGFKTIYIATGYSADDIKINSAITGVVGKEPPL